MTASGAFWQVMIDGPAMNVAMRLKVSRLVGVGCEGIVIISPRNALRAQ